MATKRLSKEEAEAGVSPEKLTKEEWHKMHEASALYEAQALSRTATFVRLLIKYEVGYNG